MGVADYPVREGPTRALRSGSREVLAAELARELSEGQADWLRDWRDMLMALAPYHHCARQIEVDVRELFADAAAATPPELAGVVRRFGERTDILPPSWDFALDRDADGPLYRSATSFEETSAILAGLRDAGFMREDEGRG